MTQNVTSEWPEYFRGLGYVVLTVDTLSPRAARDCSEINGGNIPQAEDAYAALNFLATPPEVDSSRIGVIGFSMGARTITEYIVPGTLGGKRALDFRAAIALYGRCTFRHEPGDMPLLQIVGEHDPAGPLCEAARARTGLEIFVLPGAYHAFDNRQASGGRDPFGTYMRFSWPATVRARELAGEFLGRQLSKVGG
jgi:dienelactone hydrolase